MMSWNPHVPDYSKAIVTHDGATESSPAAWNQVPNGVPGHGDPLLMNSKRLQDELERYGSKIKEHEDNLKALKGQKNQLDDSIVDMQVRLGNYHSSSSVKLEGDESPYIRSHKDILEQIMKYDKSAAGIMCQLLSHQDFQKSSSIFTQDVIGVVASLGQVDDDAVSRLLSEYLGLDTMLAIVCKSYEGVQALEVYDNEGHVNKQSGIHGLGASIARPVQGRFRVICLENLRSYCGDFITNDPQKRLDIIKPKLPNGEIPAGFLGFAVNMIKVDAKHLYYLTASGCGIRETLFYNLLSRLQVYSTRADMLRALPCISDGAISLDGGMIRNNGIFFLGSREDVDLQFPKASKLEVPLEYLEIEKQMKKFEYERDRLKEEIKREQSLLDQVKFGFHKKKQEFVKFLADSSTYINQQQMNRYPPA